MKEPWEMRAEYGMVIGVPILKTTEESIVDTRVARPASGHGKIRGYPG